MATTEQITALEGRLTAKELASLEERIFNRVLTHLPETVKTNMRPIILDIYQNEDDSIFDASTYDLSQKSPAPRKSSSHENTNDFSKKLTEIQDALKALRLEQAELEKTRKARDENLNLDTRVIALEETYKEVVRPQLNRIGDDYKTYRNDRVEIIQSFEAVSRDMNNLKSSIAQNTQS